MLYILAIGGKGILLPGQNASEIKHVFNDTFRSKCSINLFGVAPINKIISFRSLFPRVRNNNNKNY